MLKNSFFQAASLLKVKTMRLLCTASSNIQSWNMRDNRETEEKNLEDHVVCSEIENGQCNIWRPIVWGQRTADILADTTCKENGPALAT